MVDMGIYLINSRNYALDMDRSAIDYALYAAAKCCSRKAKKELLDTVRSMMAQATLSISFWGDALITAPYLLNCSPSKSINATAYELWTGRKPTIGHLQPWRSAIYVHFVSHPHRKLGSRTKKFIFLQYSKVFKRYVFLRENEDGTRTEIKSHDENFLGSEFPTI